MSAILESALDGERRAECAKHDMLANVNPVIADALRPHLRMPEFFAEFASQQIQADRLRLFIAQIKHRSTVVRSFEVMGLSRVAVQKQHEGLCGPGEYCWVMTPEEAAEPCRCDCGSVLTPEIDGLHAGGRS